MKLRERIERLEAGRLPAVETCTTAISFDAIVVKVRAKQAQRARESRLPLSRRLVLARHREAEAVLEVARTTSAPARHHRGRVDLAHAFAQTEAARATRHRRELEVQAAALAAQEARP